MGVSIDTYRAAIGTFNCLDFAICRCVLSFRILSLAILFVLLTSFGLLLLISCSVHPNPGPNNSNFSLAHLNVRSLNVVDKLSEISALTFLHGFDVIAFSETWLNSGIASDSILIPGYNYPLRKDRVGKRGGGVAIYVKDHVAVKRRYDLELSDSLELLWAQCNVDNFVILCGDDERIFFEHLQWCFDKIKSCAR